MLSCSMTSLGFNLDNHVNGQIPVLLRYNLPKMGIKNKNLVFYLLAQMIELFVNEVWKVHAKIAPW
jgi:hypothetical protein